jgi:vacuolar-type H+-ATPase subunit H
MDVAAVIRRLEELVVEAKSVPLSSSVMLNREEILAMIEELKQTLPEDIKQARWVVRNREELLKKARRDAEGLVEEGREEQKRLVAKQEVVRQAQDEGSRLLREARDQARQIRGEADDYVDAKLAAFEVALMRARDELARTIEQVAKGRERLRGTTLAGEELAPREGEQVET